MSGKKKKNKAKKNRIVLRKGCTSDVEQDKCIKSAVEKGDTTTVKLLLSQGAVTDILYTESDTLLHIAARYGHKRIIELLINHGVELHCSNSRGITPLHEAIIFGHLEAVKSLLNAYYFEGKTTVMEDRSISRIGYNYTLLHFAAKYGQTEIISFLIDSGADPDAKIYFPEVTPLHVAITYMHIDCIKLLLKYTSDLSIKKDSAIMFVAASCYFGFDRFNTDIRINIFTSNPPPSSREDELLCTEIIDILLDAGATFHDDRKNYFHALSVAAIYNRYWVVKKLLQHGLNVNSRDEENRTALHRACKYASSKIVRILLEAGADVTAVDDYGNLPIHFVAYGKNSNVLSTLIDAGADINAKTHTGKTVCKCIMRKFDKTNQKHMECLYTFVKCGLDLNVKDSDNNTVLHFLSDFYTHDHSSAFLLDTFLDLNVINTLGETPLKSAMNKDPKTRLFIIKVMIKMEYDGKFKINEPNMLLISETFSTLYQNCKNELEILKNQKFWGEITIYDILNRPLDTLKGYTLNPELMQVYESPILNSFPNYGQLMKDRMIFAHEYKNLFEESIKILDNLLFPKVIPRHIAQDIISFLNVDDMKTSLITM